MNVSVVKNSEVDPTSPEDYVRVTWTGEDTWKAKVFHLSDPRLQRYLEAVDQLKYELGVYPEPEEQDVTHMPAEQFDELARTLDEPDDVTPPDAWAWHCPHCNLAVTGGGSIWVHWDSNLISCADGFIPRYEPKRIPEPERTPFYGSCTACEREHCHCWDDAYDSCLRCREEKP